MKNNVKGITLVSMVITIIVMLILAGVSISMVVGENGVLTRASSSSIKTNLASVAEDFNLAVSDLEMQYQDTWTDSSAVAAFKGIYITIEKLNETLSQSKILTTSEFATATPTQEQKAFKGVSNITDKDLKALLNTTDHPVCQWAGVTAGAEGDLKLAKNPTNKYFVLYLSNGDDGTKLGSDVYAAICTIESGIPKLIDIGLVEDAIVPEDLKNGDLKYTAATGSAEEKLESGTKGTLPTAVTWLNEELGLKSSTDEE